jgi:hypothetical protein
MRRRAVVVVLALLVALAGCNGLGGTATEQSKASVTPAPVPTTAAGNGTVVAPGLTDRVVTDPLELARAHVATLRNRSYAVEYNRTVQYGNGSVRTRQGIDGTVGVKSQRYRFVVDWAGSAANDSRTVYHYDGRRVIRERSLGGVTTRRIVMDGRGIGAAPADPVDVLPFDPRFGDRLYRLLSAIGSSSVTAVTRTGSDRATYRVRTDVLGNLDRQVSNAAGVVIVEETGLVRQYRFRYETVRDGQSVTVIEQFSVSNVSAASRATATAGE